MIQRIDIESIKDIKRAAIKENLVFCDKTELYGKFVDGKCVAIGGILRYRKKVILKNFYVIPSYRGNGYFKEMFDFLLDRIREKQIKIIEANCTAMSLREHLKRGFIVVKKYKSITKVRYENIFE